MSNKYNIAGDPGHGGKDPGASKGNIIEAHQVLKLTTDWMREVERRTKEEIMIYRTRTKDEWKSLKDRTDWINSWRKNGKGFDICVSVHRDSFTNKSAKGITIYVQKGCYKGDTKRLADIFDKHLDKVGFQDRNIKEQNFHMTRETIMPAILIEVGFISNDDDNKKFEKDYNKIVKAMADATIEYFNVKDKGQSQNKPQSAPQKPSSTPSNSNYKLVPQRGRCTVIVDELNIREKPSTKSKSVGTYKKGESVNYDYYVDNEGYRWISWIGKSGIRRYMAVRVLSTNKKYGNCV